MVFREAVRAGVRIPAIIFRASGLNCRPRRQVLAVLLGEHMEVHALPALPTVIFGAKLISTPYW